MRVSGLLKGLDLVRLHRRTKHSGVGKQLGGVGLRQKGRHGVEGLTQPPDGPGAAAHKRIHEPRGGPGSAGRRLVALQHVHGVVSTERERRTGSCQPRPHDNDVGVVRHGSENE